MELNADVERTAERSDELAGELAAAERELERARAEYKRAVGVLSDRLVEIYKGTEVDNVTVLLESSGFDDFQTRAEYLSALHEADAEIADEVAALKEEVSAEHERIAGLKAEIDEQARHLESARAEMAGVRAEAAGSAPALDEARAAAQAEPDEMEWRK